MKILLVGPYPPPHGGVSVHVAGLKVRADKDGIECRVLNSDRSAPASPDYVRIRSGLDFFRILARHTFDGWTIHVHTNGHNARSWMVALACAIAGVAGRKPGHLTIHSGMTPAFLESSATGWWLAWTTCRLVGRITCVSPHIRNALESLGLRSGSVEVAHAGTESIENVLVLKERGLSAPNETIADWLRAHHPVLAATGTSRPEYGITLLSDAVRQLKSQFPRVGCVVMGMNDADQRSMLLAVGDIPHTDCLKLMSTADVFVRPTFVDGDSISIREALALKVPVVASDCVRRPDGTVLFKTGNSMDLAERLECVLQQCSAR